MIESYLQPENLVALSTLTVLEIILGIDNIIFISILSSTLPPSQQDLGRRLGIGLAVGSRILLLLAISWVTGLIAPLFSLLGHSFSGRDLILLTGGMFLIAKSTFEIHEKLEAIERDHTMARASAGLGAVLAQIMLIDLVFSLDSVVTAVGISGRLSVMIPAIALAAVVMLVFAGPVSRFVDQHPTMKILALAFLILIGLLLVIEGWNSELVHSHHLRNYAYFAMAFSLAVELVNMRFRRPGEPVSLHNRPRAAGKNKGSRPVAEKES